MTKLFILAVLAAFVFIMIAVIPHIAPIIKVYQTLQGM